MLAAAVEGVALGIRLAVDALPGVGAGTTLVLVGGGGADPGYRQLLADVLGHDLQSLDVEAASARGAALIAGVAAGSFGSVEAAVGEGPALGGITRVRPEVHAAYADRHARFLEVSAALG